MREWYERLLDIGISLTKELAEAKTGDLFASGKSAVSVKELQSRVDTYRKLVSSFADMVQIAREKAEEGAKAYEVWLAELDACVKQLQNRYTHD